MYLSYLGRNVRHHQGRALAFACIHEQPFSLPCYCEITYLPSVPLVAQTAF